MKDKLRDVYTIWVFGLVMELGWLLISVMNGNSFEIIVFIMSLIIVTIAIGAVGINILLKEKQ